MKINGSELQSKLTVYQTAQMQEQNHQSTRSQTTHDRVSEQEKVVISDRGRLISDVQRAVAEVPDVRESLVARIQAELDKGTYRFDFQQAAENLLKESMVNQAALG